MDHKHQDGEALLHSLLEAFTMGAEAVVALFAETATIVYPYASSIGGVTQLSKAEYRTYLQNILPDMPKILFSNIRVYALCDAKAYWAEFDGQTTVPTTGKEYRQAYVVYFTVENNRFVMYREYWNPVPYLQAYGHADDVVKSTDTGI